MKPEKNIQTTVSEETELKTAIKPIVASAKNKTNKPSLWKSVLVGGVPGVLIGASGMGAVEAAAAEPGSIEVPGESVDAAAAEVQSAHSVNDEMSFSEAFAAAREEVGPGGAFVWHGNVYSTYRSDDPEWLEMTSDERMEHSHQIISQVPRVPYEPSDGEPPIELDPSDPANNVDESSQNQELQENQGEGQVHGQENEPTNPEEVIPEPQSDESNGEVDVHIVGVEQIQTEEGHVLQVGYGEVDGQEAVFADIDGDGEVDTVLIDNNDNGEVDEDEIFNAEGSGITMDTLSAEAEINSSETLDDQLYADMPDYTNDADTSSLV